MKKFMTVLAALAAFSSSSAVYSDNHQPVIGGVETLACNFAEGKNMDDFMKVVRKWDAWASKNFSKEYTGNVLVPHFFNEMRNDFYWVGFSPSLAAQGIVADEWLAKGEALQREFDAVAPCNAHGQYAWMRVRDNAESPRQAGFVDFASCDMKPGADSEKLANADEKMNAFLDKIGNTSGTYRWFPMQGTNNQGLDFLQLNWAGSLTEKGENADSFIAAGGLQVRAALYDSLVECTGGFTAAFSAAGGS